MLWDDDSGSETILEIDVRGKRGVGFCKSMPGAVFPFERHRERCNPKPTDLVFPRTHHMLFNAILAEEGLKFDREGSAAPSTACGIPTFACDSWRAQTCIRLRRTAVPACR